MAVDEATATIQPLESEKESIWRRRTRTPRPPARPPRSMWCSQRFASGSRIAPNWSRQLLMHAGLYSTQGGSVRRAIEHARHEAASVVALSKIPLQDDARRTGSSRSSRSRRHGGAETSGAGNRMRLASFSWWRASRWRRRHGRLRTSSCRRLAASPRSHLAIRPRCRTMSRRRPLRTEPTPAPVLSDCRSEIEVPEFRLRHWVPEQTGRSAPGRPADYLDHDKWEHMLAITEAAFLRSYIRMKISPQPAAGEAVTVHFRGRIRRPGSERVSQRQPVRRHLDLHGALARRRQKRQRRRSWRQRVPMEQHAT